MPFTALARAALRLLLTGSVIEPAAVGGARCSEEGEGTPPAECGSADCGAADNGVEARGAAD